MKKSITMLIAFSLVGLAGCSNAKLNARPKGVRIDATTFEAEILSKIDNFRANLPFVVTNDAEDVKTDFVVEKASTISMTGSRTTSNGKSYKLVEKGNENSVMKFDNDSTRFSLASAEKDKRVESDEKQEYYEQENYTYTEERVYNNLTMTKAEAAGLDVKAAALAYTNGVVAVMDDIYDDCTAYQFSSGDYQTYKLGNTYTYIQEVNASVMMPGATGKLIDFWQCTITKNSFEYVTYEEYKDLQYVTNGFRTTAHGTMSQYGKLAKKSVKIAQPKDSKYIG